MVIHPKAGYGANVAGRGTLRHLLPVASGTQRRSQRAQLPLCERRMSGQTPNVAWHQRQGGDDRGQSSAYLQQCKVDNT